MSTKLAKAFRLRRYQMILLIIITVCISSFFFLYVNAIKARTERFVFSVNLDSLKKTLNFNELLSIKGDKPCDYLDKHNIIISNREAKLSLNPSQVQRPFTPDNWQFHNNRFTYKVNTTRFFFSNVGQKIVVSIQCDNGRVTMKVSPHIWCKEIRFWGCSKW